MFYLGDGIDLEEIELALDEITKEQPFELRGGNPTEMLSEFKRKANEWPVCCGLPTVHRCSYGEGGVVIRFVCEYCKEAVPKAVMEKGNYRPEGMEF